MLTATFGLDTRAVEAWDRRAEDILSSAGPKKQGEPVEARHANLWEQEMHIPVHLTDGEEAHITGPAYIRNGLGQLIGVEISTSQGLQVVCEKGAGEIQRLCEIVITKCPQIARIALFADIEESLCKWIERRLTGATTDPFSKDLHDSVNRIVGHRKVLIIIEGLLLNEDLQVGRSRLRVIRRSEIDIVVEKSMRRVDSSMREEIEGHFRRKYQGQPAVLYEILGTPRFRHSEALRRADRLLSILRFFHPAAMELRVHCDLVRKGTPGRTSHQIVEMTGEEITEMHDSYDGNVEMMPLEIGNDEIQMLMRMGMRRAVRITDIENESEWNAAIWQAIWTFSSGMESYSPANRIAHAYSAIEGLVMRNNEGEIQAKVARRVGYIIGDDVESRVAIKAELIEGYALRSRYVHGGREVLPSEIEKGNIAIQRIWSAIVRLLHRTDLQTQGALVDEFERRELT